MAQSTVIKDIIITPVAFHDMPLLNSVGVHEPFALRSIIEVITEDTYGLGESYGDSVHLNRLNKAAEALKGVSVYDTTLIYQKCVDCLDGDTTTGGDGMAGLVTTASAADKVFSPFEVACLDIQGKKAGIPVNQLLGGRVRDNVQFSAYLFYKWAGHPGSPDDEYGAALDPSGLVQQAKKIIAEYGFKAIKLKGGVFPPAQEVEAIKALHAAFPDAPLRLDPNAAWTVETSKWVAKELDGILEYLEDPAPEIEGMAAVAREASMPLATNMAVVAFPHLPPAISQDAVQVVLSDHHFWGGLRKSQVLGGICATWGMRLSMHSNSHLGISLAAMTHLAAATPNLDYACDTHWPWKRRDEDVVVEGALKWADGGVVVPTAPGLGVELDREKLARLHQQYLDCGLPGEIVIGGISVARGYLNNEAQTRASFVPDRFATNDDARRGWTTMCRTKDRGRLLRDGQLLVEGRIDGDTEIKLRGMRLDLREVEQTLLRVTSGVLSDAAVSRLLADLPLPDYMCPVALMAIDRMPTTASSKLDREAIWALPITQMPAGSTAPNGVSRPLSTVESQVKSVRVEVLRHGPFQPDAIDAESDFFHVGDTSMLLVEVQAHLRKQLDSAVPLIALFKNSTLVRMARVHMREQEQKQEEVIGLDGAIDWEVETRPPVDLWDVHDIPFLHDLQSQSQAQALDAAATTSGGVVSALAAARPKTILHTGAGGFLGRHILQRLIASNGVAKIICVAVHNLQERLDTGQLPIDPRVVYYESDLPLPRLGLTPDEAGTIFGAVDAAIHNAADVSHLKSYATLKAANVVSTTELARLCLPRGVSIHYVSTAGVAMLAADAPRTEFGEVSASDGPPPADGLDGYTSSKWASERLLERISDATGLPVWIHRPSSIVRPEADARADAESEAEQRALGSRGAPQFDLLQSLLLYSRRMRAVPMSPSLQGTLDLVSVDSVTRTLVEEVLGNRPRGEAGRLVSFVHHTGDWAIPLDGMKEHLERRESDGGSGDRARATDYEALSLHEWAVRAEKARLHTTVAAVFAHAESHGSLVFPRFIKTLSRG